MKNLVFKLFPNKILQIIYSRYKTHQLRRQYRPAEIAHQNILRKFPNHLIIWMSDDKMKQGGLCDRLWGAISTYSRCQSLNFNFKIHFISPFDLTKYLIPNHYNWEINKEEITKDSNLATPFFWPDLTSVSNTKYLDNILLRNSKSFQQIHIYTNLKSDIDFTNIFNHLFKPSNYLTEHLNKILSTVPYKKFISISFRFIGLLGDFKDVSNTQLTPSQQAFYMEKCKNAILDLPIPDGCGILVTSDSPRFQEYISDLPNVFKIPGKISHLGNNICDDDSHLKTFLDLFMISKAEKAYFGWYGEMYKHSAFARTGALIGAVPFEIIEL